MKEQIFRAIEDASMAAEPVLQSLLSAHKIAAGQRMWKTVEKIQDTINRLREDERDKMVSAVTDALREEQSEK